ncbi:hypothetical protein CEXT_433911 [Caerostris extrusa]|uniref:Uncharacterized protein n=1 Tax=Caerostris extrusa TaxID=172846 RepID=A0AAV4WA66_CAEEX|nr:hypothetical protein CEXT_433911 [Caerostris extrusa]
MQQLRGSLLQFITRSSDAREGCSDAKRRHSSGIDPEYLRSCVKELLAKKCHETLILQSQKCWNGGSGRLIAEALSKASFADSSTLWVNSDWRLAGKLFAILLLFERKKKVKKRDMEMSFRFESINVPFSWMDPEILFWLSPGFGKRIRFRLRQHYYQGFRTAGPSPVIAEALSKVIEPKSFEDSSTLWVNNDLRLAGKLFAVLLLFEKKERETWRFRFESINVPFSWIDPENPFPFSPGFGKGIRFRTLSTLLLVLLLLLL